MNTSTRREFLKQTALAGGAACLPSCAHLSSGDDADKQAQIEAGFQQAAKSAELAGFSLSKVQRWLHERALPAIDRETGLYRSAPQFQE